MKLGQGELASCNGKCQKATTVWYKLCPRRLCPAKRPKDCATWIWNYSLRSALLLHSSPWGIFPSPLDWIWCSEKVHHQYIYKLSLGESCFCFPSELSQRMAFLTSWQFQKSKRTLLYLHANYLNKTYLDYFHFGLFSILCFLINFYFRNMNWSKTTKVTFVWKVKSCMFL